MYEHHLEIQGLKADMATMRESVNDGLKTIQYNQENMINSLNRLKSSVDGVKSSVNFANLQLFFKK